MRVASEINKLRGPNLEGHFESPSQLARSPPDLGRVHGHHQRLVPGRAAALHERAGRRHAAAEIELKPRIAFGRLNHRLERSRRDRGHADGNALSRRHACQHQIGAGRRQIAHAHGADAKRQAGLLPEQRHAQAAVFGAAQHPRLQHDVA